MPTPIAAETKKNIPVTGAPATNPVMLAVLLVTVPNSASLLYVAFNPPILSYYAKRLIVGKIKSQLLMISSYLFMFSGWLSPFSITEQIQKIDTLHSALQYWNSLIERAFLAVGLTMDQLGRTIVSSTVLMAISQNFASLLYTGKFLPSLTFIKGKTHLHYTLSVSPFRVSKYLPALRSYIL